MAAKPLTTEEKNFLKSVYLTFIIGTDALRTYFDFLHPPANLVTHLANNKSTLEKLLKGDDITCISRTVWEKLYPRGARPTSAEFDITTLICLLREMKQKVIAPRHTGFDQLPGIADDSPGACLANIKYYRNFLAHPEKVKLKTLSCTTFNDLFTRVGMAIKVLGNNQYCSKVEKARQLNIDNDFAEILEKFVTHEKQLEDLHGSVQQIRKQTNHLQTLCDDSGDKSDELENEIRTLETSLQELEKDISDIKSKLKLDREDIEKKVIDLSKQLAEFKTQTNATLALHGKNITELSEKQQDYHSLTEGLEKTAKQVDQLKSKEEVHGKEIKDLQENEQSQKEGLENTAKQLDDCKRETNKIGEIQIQHLKRVENLEKETESLKLNEKVHGKEIKDLQENQQGGRNQTSLEGNHQHPIPYKLGEPIFSSYHQVDMSLVDSNGSVGITDMEMMDDGRLLICVPEKRKLLIYNSDGSQEDCIRMEGHPSHITRVTFCLVAVTLWNGGLIEMYDINNKLKFKSIRVPDLLGSKITTINNKLVVCNTYSYQLLIIDYQTEEKVEKDTKCYVHGLHGSGDKIFYFDILNNNKLYWYSYTDDLHDSITLPSLPRVMTTLLDGSLYVMCKDGSVQHVSSDGKQFETTTIKGLTRMKKYVFIYNSNQRKLITGGDQDGVLILFYEN